MLCCVQRSCGSEPLLLLLCQLQWAQEWGPPMARKPLQLKRHFHVLIQSRPFACISTVKLVFQALLLLAVNESGSRMSAWDSVIS